MTESEKRAGATRWEKILISKSEPVADPKNLLTRIEQLEKKDLTDKELQKELGTLLN